MKVSVLSDLLTEAKIRRREEGRKKRRDLMEGEANQEFSSSFLDSVHKCFILSSHHHERRGHSLSFPK